MSRNPTSDRRSSRPPRWLRWLALKYLGLLALLAGGFGLFVQRDVIPLGFHYAADLWTRANSQALPIRLTIYAGLVLALGLIVALAWAAKRLSPSSPALSLMRVRDLSDTNYRLTLGLGDVPAAEFPFLLAPVQAAYDRATHALHTASVGAGDKRGILMVGQANSGKTRLALEALIRPSPSPQQKTLLDWPVIVWDPTKKKEDMPTTEQLRGQNLVIFLDDLQKYALPAGPNTVGLGSEARALASGAAIVEELVKLTLRDAKHAVVVATCRSEDEQGVRDVLGFLFDVLEQIDMPRFSKNAEDPRAKLVIGEFASAGAQHLNDWDGTLGSLVLGLSKKRTQYAQLQNASAQILRAMKLLTLEGTPQLSHTAKRIRGVCATVYGIRTLDDDEETWRTAKEELIRLGFARQAISVEKREETLVILKDAYLNQVITDYPRLDGPEELELDRTKLEQVFQSQQDAEGLFNLGASRLFLIDYSLVLSWATLASIPIPPDFYDVWFAHNPAVEARIEEGLAIIQHAIALRPNYPQAWLVCGIFLSAQRRDVEALDALQRALSLDPDNPLALIGEAVVVARIGRAEEALIALKQAQVFGLDSGVLAINAFNISLTLAGEHVEHALTALQVAVNFGPPAVSALAELISGCLLRQQGRREAADKAIQHAIGTGLVLPLEAAIANADDGPENIAQIYRQFVASTPFALGVPADSQTDLLHFAADDTSGKERVLLPVFTQPIFMTEALVRNPEWQRHLVLAIQDSKLLLEQLEPNVITVVNPWTPLEFRLPARDGTVFQ